MTNLHGDSDNHDNAKMLHAHFGGLEQVVADDATSKLQKLDALDVLEQDARQLATASNEGMAGGEPTQLREVLEARQALEAPPIALAYAAVLADLWAPRYSAWMGTGLCGQPEVELSGDQVDHGYEIAV